MEVAGHPGGAAASRTTSASPDSRSGPCDPAIGLGPAGFVLPSPATEDSDRGRAPCCPDRDLAFPIALTGHPEQTFIKVDVVESQTEDLAAAGAGAR